MKRILGAVLLAATLPILPASAQQPAQPTTAEEQAMLTRGMLEALRANTETHQKNTAILETLTNRIERLEAATRSVPPSVEGARTDLIAIRATVERVAAGQGIKRPAASLKFGPFACGNESEAACATNACKSVGYASGIGINLTRTGTGASARATGINEATCYD